MVPIEVAAPKVTVPVPHREPGTVPTITGTAFIVAITGILGDEVHPVFVAST
jgi:hypothetical protein